MLNENLDWHAIIGISCVEKSGMNDGHIRAPKEKEQHGEY